jgi:hypothetical protein
MKADDFGAGVKLMNAVIARGLVAADVEELGPQALARMTGVLSVCLFANRPLFALTIMVCLAWSARSKDSDSASVERVPGSASVMVHFLFRSIAPKYRAYTRHRVTDSSTLTTLLPSLIGLLSLLAETSQRQLGLTIDQEHVSLEFMLDMLAAVIADSSAVTRVPLHEIPSLLIATLASAGAGVRLRSLALIRRLCARGDSYRERFTSAGVIPLLAAAIRDGETAAGQVHT